jgi:hypothetical protein
MFGYKRVNIAPYERGVMLRNGSFDSILEPGPHNVFGAFAKIEVSVHDLRVAEFEHPRVDSLVREARELMARYFVIVELGEHEAGVVFKNGRLSGVLAPGKRQLYWRGAVEVHVERQDISKELELWRARVTRKACTIRTAGVRHGGPRLITDARARRETRGTEKAATASSA